MKFRTLLASLLYVLGISAPAAAAAPKPHIVFVLADDMGNGDVGCYGGKMAPTPNLDRLAREGTRFTRYYSASPICSPSRCGLITGQFPARWRITSYLQARAGNRKCEQDDFLDPKAPSLPRVLQAAGYATAHIGKWHLGGGRDVTNAPKFAAYGYDLGLGTYESPEPAAGLGLKTTPWGTDREPQQVARHERTRWMVDETLAFLKKNADRPCFVNLWLDDTHTPWVPEGAAGGGNGGRANLIKVITEMDRQLGRLMDSIPTNTLLIFASDNGALPTFQGERSGGLRGSKLSLYEGGLRLPFIARWPGGVPAARVNDTTVLHAVDVLPTLASIAGAKLPVGYASDGEDFSATLLGQAAVRTKPLFWEYGRNNKSFSYPAATDRSPNVAMREGNWKLLINADGSSAELYDLAADPNETRNLVTQHPDTATRLRAQLTTWLAVLQPPGTGTGPMAPTSDDRFDHHLEGKESTDRPGSETKKANAQTTPQPWQARNGKLTVKDGILEITPEPGMVNKPFIVRSQLQLAAPFTARLSVKASTAGGAFFAWRTAEQKDFLPENRADFAVTASQDWQTHEVPLPAKGSITHLRLHLPGGTTQLRDIQFQATEK